MSNQSFHTFDCQIYVPRQGLMNYRLPEESGPTRVARFEPLEYDELVDPGFRRLLATFNSVTAPTVLAAGSR